MKTAAAVLAAAMVVAAEADAGASVVDPAADPFILYGAAIDFDVYRSGDKVGFHRVRFERVDADLVVTSEFELRVDVLFFTAYQFRYRSVDRWRNGQLVSLKAVVDDDGTTGSTEAQLEGERMRVRGPRESFHVDVPLFPTNHWHSGVLDETRVLNTLTGRLNAVQIELRGLEPVPTERGEVIATRYVYTGELDTEAWYDAAGRWVKLRFLGSDGSVIEYVCRRCLGTDPNEVRR